MLGGGGGDVGACASTEVVHTTFLRNPPTLLPRKTPALPGDGRVAPASSAAAARAAPSKRAGPPKAVKPAAPPETGVDTRVFATV